MNKLHCFKSHFSLFSARFLFVEGGGAEAEGGFRLKEGTEARREQAERAKKETKIADLEESYRQGADKLIRSFNEPVEKLSPKQMREKQARLAKFEKEMEASRQPGVAERELLAWANTPEKDNTALAKKQPKKHPSKPIQLASNPTRGRK